MGSLGHHWVYMGPQWGPRGVGGDHMEPQWGSYGANIGVIWGLRGGGLVEASVEPQWGYVGSEEEWGLYGVSEAYMGSQ